MGEAANLRAKQSCLFTVSRKVGASGIAQILAR
jgi:integrase/recombinase XerD